MLKFSKDEIVSIGNLGKSNKVTIQQEKKIRLRGNFAGKIIHLIS